MAATGLCYERGKLTFAWLLASLNSVEAIALGGSREWSLGKKRNWFQRSIISFMQQIKKVSARSRSKREDRHQLGTMFPSKSACNLKACSVASLITVINQPGLLLTEDGNRPLLGAPPLPPYYIINVIFRENHWIFLWHPFGELKLQCAHIHISNINFLSPALYVLL